MFVDLEIGRQAVGAVAGGFENWRIASDDVVVKENQGVCVSLLML
jgi:hypothetical protein